MASILQNVAIDCADAYELATFWSRVTGRPLHPEAAPGDPETQVVLADGPALYFNQVPEPKTVKNRTHLDIRLDGDDKDAVRTALEKRGAQFLYQGNEGPHIWYTMTDPEGNEFCVS